MKKSLLILAVACTALFSGCKKAGTGETEDPIKVSLEVTGIENNSATIKAELTSGKASGAKIIEDYILDDVTIDYTKDIQLVNFVEANGVKVDLPYEKTLSGVKIGKDRFTAIIVYDNTGRAAVTAYQVWTPEGLPEGWSTENNPGELGEIKW